MAQLVNQESKASVNEFIKNIKSKSKREDSKLLVSLMQDITGFEPKVWGNLRSGNLVNSSFIAFGKYKYRRKNGKEEFEWFHVGFAPRTAKITIYLTFDITLHKKTLEKLGKCKWGKGCLYINKVADVDLEILKEIIALSKDSKWL